MPRLDRLDDTMLRGAQLVMQIMAKKMELNANLDKERRRAGGTIAKDSAGSGGNSVSGGTQIHFQQFSHNVVGFFLLYFFSIIVMQCCLLKLLVVQIHFYIWKLY